MTIRFLTIHSSATPEGRDVTPETIASWHNGRAPYHFVVPLDGVFVRTLNDSQLGAHTRRANTGNAGICYIGGVSADNKLPKDTRTEAQKAALLTLVRTYKGRYPDIIIRGHRDWSTDTNRNGMVDRHEWYTVCPSFDVAAWLREVGEA